MPKVSKIKSRRAKNDSPGGGSTSADNSSDHQDAESNNVPSIPPIKGSSSPEKGGRRAKRDREKDGEEGAAEPRNGSGGAKKVAPNDVLDADTEEKPPPSSLSNAPVSLANDFRGGQESWNAMLYQLLLYKAQRGDLNIPHNDTSYRLLYNWVQTQRKHYKLYQENKTSSTFLNADRIAVLDAIDFQWNVRGDTFWQKNFDSLVAYKNEHGDARVPRLYNKNPKLGEWVTDQRRQWKAKMEGKPNIMTEERKAKLDELGFVWKVRDRADWNDRYEQLLEFKKENGHCIVPQHYTRNRALGKWVAKQREQYRFYREGKHSFLTEERIDLLKSVGFVWQIKGRGVNKKLPGKSPSGAKLNDDVKEKSLAKVEEEEMKQAANSGMATAAELHGLAPIPGSKEAALAAVLGMPSHQQHQLSQHLQGDASNQQLPSLPPLSQQQLLQANMAAIAAHASSNQNMVADLAAALRLGGATSNAVTLGDPRAVAALRAAQLGSDPKTGLPFSSMI
ncbi:hypothetical protein ACHAXR_013067 [Thalassiosira sp. AJA248-18]